MRRWRFLLATGLNHLVYTACCRFIPHDIHGVVTMIYAPKKRPEVAHDFDCVSESQFAN